MVAWLVCHTLSTTGQGQEGRTAAHDRQDRPDAGQASSLPTADDERLERVEVVLRLHGAHDLRHTFSTWLEDAGIPARVIDELMGHQASGRRAVPSGPTTGNRPEMAPRVVAAVEERLAVVRTPLLRAFGAGQS